jgi:hypothetical protein
VQLIAETYVFAEQQNVNANGKIFVRIIEDGGIVWADPSVTSVNSHGDTCSPRVYKDWRKIANLLFKKMSKMQTGWAKI